jgi:coenzyme F420-reducing hydrogenase beta subunit
MVNLVIRINDKKDCMGCHACSNICPQRCISMENDSEGFLYPEVDCAKCIKCGLCVKACPVINKTMVDNDPIAYACINTNEKIRLDSSSGGIFTLIAEQIIDEDGVVFGASFDDNLELIHSYVDKKDELSKFRGSKYVQSKIGDTYYQAKVFLRQGRKVLFSGTPCQIAGLKLYLGQSYDNLFCVDIVCHGVPSPKAFKKYIDYIERKFGLKTRRIAFRRKNEGWKRYSIAFTFENGLEHLQTNDKDIYIKAFLKNVCLRPSCYACEFKSLHRQSDMTLADFWGIQKVLPEMDDDKGTSLIFVNSDSGKLMLKNIGSKTICKKVDINYAVKHNSAAVESVGFNSKREKFFNDLDCTPFNQLVNKYCSDSVGVRLNREVKLLIRKILQRTGLYKHIRRTKIE